MTMKSTERPVFGRRSLLKGAAVAGFVTFSGGAAEAAAGLSSGDAAILRFLAAVEIIETDMWQQYNELAGVQDAEVPGGSGNPAFTEALMVLEEESDIYIHDNTENEMTHELFLNAYLEDHGAAPANLEMFRTLPSSKATGAQQIGRLTNLMQLTLDTSWWTRYRDPNHNPDLDGNVFAPAVPDLLNGMFPGIPRTDDDLDPPDHLQAIANTAAFHFPSIEVGGTSLYPQLAQRVSGAQPLRIVLSIGPTEAMHFQTWHDVAGHAPAITDPTNGLTFPDLEDAGELFKASLIMPEPCPFISTKFPPCAVVRPTRSPGAANDALVTLTKMGIFRGQSDAFFDTMRGLAHEADMARREMV